MSISEDELQLLTKAVMQTRGLTSALQQGDIARAERLAASLQQAFEVKAQAHLQSHELDEISKQILQNVMAFDLSDIEPNH